MGKAVAAVAVLVVAIVGAAPHVSAATGDATLSRTVAGKNGDITLTAGGFAPNSKVGFYNHPVGNALTLGFGENVTADGSGNVTKTFRSLFTSGRVELVGVTTEGAPRRTTAVYGVTSACENGTCVTLPRTGGLPPIAIGLMAIALGAVALRVARSYPLSRTALAALVVAVATIVPGLIAGRASAATGTGSITGVVQDENSAPLADVCVFASAGADMGMARSAADGTFTISSLPAGSFSLLYADCHADPSYFDFNDPTPIAVTTTAATAPTRKLARGGNVSGKVVDATTANTLGGICLHVVDPETAGSFSDCVFGTADSGAYVVGPLPAGSYSLAYVDVAHAHANRYSGNANDDATDTPFAVTKGGVTGPTTVALPSAATVSGTVKDDATNAAPAGTVCVFDLSHDVLTAASSFVGDEGEFTIKNVAPGDHKFKFGKCQFSENFGYTEQFYAQKATLAAADVVPLTSGQAKTGVDARIAANGVPAPSSTTTTTTAASTTTTTSAPPSTTTTAAPTGGTTTTTAAAATRLTPTGTASTGASSVEQGALFSASGSGFKPGSTVNAVLFSTPKVVGQATVGSNGTVSFNFQIPTDLPTGTHEVQLQGIDSQNASRVLSATFTVRTGVLRRTGANTASMLLVAFGLISLGVAFRASTNSRRTGAHFVR